MAFQYNPNQGQQQYAQPQQQYQAPVQQQGIDGHPHAPTERDSGSVPITQAWFNWAGQQCDALATQLNRKVSKTQLCEALLNMYHQDANLKAQVAHLVSQMPVKTKGRKASS